jgi:molybdopterin converting factor small subunit
VAVTFLLPRALLPYARGAAEIVVDGAPATVREALAALGRSNPPVRDRILTERGELRPHVNIFVGAEHIGFLGGLDAPLPAGAVVSVVPAVSGG